MNVNKYEQYREREAMSDIFTWTILRHSFLCLNILWLKAIRQTRTSFAKFIKGSSIEYLTTQIYLLLPTFKSWTVQKIMQYLTLGLLSSLRYLSQCNSVLFLTHFVCTSFVRLIYSTCSVLLCSECSAVNSAVVCLSTLLTYLLA